MFSIDLGKVKYWVIYITVIYYLVTNVFQMYHDSMHLEKCWKNVNRVIDKFILKSHIYLTDI